MCLEATCMAVSLVEDLFAFSSFGRREVTTRSAGWYLLPRVRPKLEYLMYPLCCNKAVSEYVEVINFHTQKIAWAINQRAFQRKVTSAFLRCPQIDSN